MKISKITKNEIVASVWNGGETFEYFIYPPTSSYTERNFLFRISIATINLVPSIFTRFTNYNRYLIMLDNDLNIRINEHDKTFLRNEIFSFDSNDLITSYSTGTDFNLMIHKSIVESSVRIVSNDVQSRAQFIILFAVTDSLLQVDHKQFHLNKFDLIVIKNTDKKIIEIKSCYNFLYCQLTP